MSSRPLASADEVPGIGGRSGRRAPASLLLPLDFPLWNQSPQSNGDVSLPPDIGGRREDGADDGESPLFPLRSLPPPLLPAVPFFFSHSKRLSSKLFSSTPDLYLAKSGRGSFGGRSDDGVEADDEKDDGFTTRSLRLLPRCPGRLFILTCGRRFLLSLTRALPFAASLPKSLSYPGRGGRIDAAAAPDVDASSPPFAGSLPPPASGLLGSSPPGLERAAMARSFAFESSLSSSAPPLLLLASSADAA
mmetsp:Transcript_34714/g.102033  ORF Transcript_34714/g.102033 Transcript_34714/m.102033 type:complete len:248 (-) Transcript_34714:299-1042(-)